jgi:SAM-dependent MidA family methyltransferase
MTELPLPTDEQLQIHQLLLQRIIAEIESNGGIDFCRYMQICLYEPGLGYYLNSFPKLGERGDFTTAAEMSNDFAGCLAAQIAAMPPSVAEGTMLEFGGGSGKLACDIMLALDERGLRPAHYLLLDVSADMRARQRATVETLLPGDLRQRVEWVESLPTSLTGVVIANELFDAFPVERFRVSHGLVNREYVVADGQRLLPEFRPHKEVAAEVARIQSYTGDVMADAYVSEYCPMLAPWWRSLDEVLHTGAVLACDYGLGRAEYYASGRDGGTLRCFYRHRVHNDPLSYAGIQDITADVDFTAVTEAAVGAGFELQGYTPLSQFMLSLGVLDDFSTKSSHLGLADQVAASGQLKRLLLPEEMGDRFKVIGFSKRIDEAMPGFQLADHTRLL